MSEIISFRQLGLADPLLLALAEVGYERPSPIQAACIPVLLTGRDVLGEAQTGTGKTAAFALPILQQVDCAQEVPQALVLTPTRELAIQVAEAFQRYARHLPGFHVLPVYGGQGMGAQLRQLKRGAQVIVGTPGRVMDHLERGTLRLDQLRSVVLDEADEMLRMGFVDDVEWILNRVPTERQIVLFSATMPPPIRQVAERHMRDAESIRIPASTVTVDTITQHYCQVAAEHKLEALTRILEVEEAIDAALVFVRTKTATVEIAERLEARGYAVAALNGDLTQPLRERVIEQFRDGRLDIVVATDVAARGLDVSRVSHVINFDIPYDPEAYVHRIGRTGRAGRKGTAILFVTPRESRLLAMIERTTRQKVLPMPLPSRGTVTDRRIAQFRQRVDTVLASEDLTFFREVITDFASDFDIEMPELAAALAWMAQEDRPLRGEPDPTPDFAHAPSPAPAQSRYERNRKPRDAGGGRPGPRYRDSGAPGAGGRYRGRDAERGTGGPYRDRESGQKPANRSIDSSGDGRAPIRLRPGADARGVDSGAPGVRVSRKPVAGSGAAGGKPYTGGKARGTGKPYAGSEGRTGKPYAGPGRGDERPRANPDGRSGKPYAGPGTRSGGKPHASAEGRTGKPYAGPGRSGSGKPWSGADGRPARPGSKTRPKGPRKPA